MRYNIIGKNIDVWDKTKEMVEKIEKYIVYMKILKN